MRKPYTRPKLRTLEPTDSRVRVMQDEEGGLLVEAIGPDGSVCLGRVGVKTYEALREHYRKQKA